MTENPNESKAVTKGTLAAGFSVASVWFGTHVGAGFATGNQVLNYYVQYGWTAVLFPLISMGILAYVIYVIMKFARLRGPRQLQRHLPRAVEPLSAAGDNL